jgi:hypothetical protein
MIIGFSGSYLCRTNGTHEWSISALMHNSSNPLDWLFRSGGVDDYEQSGSKSYNITMLIGYRYAFRLLTAPTSSWSLSIRVRKPDGNQDILSQDDCETAEINGCVDISASEAEGCPLPPEEEDGISWIAVAIFVASCIVVIVAVIVIIVCVRRKMKKDEEKKKIEDHDTHANAEAPQEKEAIEQEGDYQGNHFEAGKETVSTVTPSGAAGDTASPSVSHQPGAPVASAQPQAYVPGWYEAGGQSTTQGGQPVWNGANGQWNNPGWGGAAGQSTAGQSQQWGPSHGAMEADHSLRSKADNGPVPVAGEWQTAYSLYHGEKFTRLKRSCRRAVPISINPGVI